MKNNDNYDIIILGGQSNAEGYGKGDVTEEYERNEKILWLNDKANPHFEKGIDGNDFLAIDYPSETNVEIADEPCDNLGKTGKLALFFAKKYVESGFLNSGRKLLIINAAVGGTGFARNEWGVGNVLYNRMLSMTDEVISQNDKNRIVAFLWHQGECDAFENASWTVAERYRKHYYNLRRQTESLKIHFGTDIPFICGGFCDEWYNKNKTSSDAVQHAIKDVCRDIGGKFVETHGLLSNNQKTGNGDDIHFCREASHILGSNYFNAYRRIINK